MADRPYAPSEGGVDVGLCGLLRARRPFLGECRETGVDHLDVGLSVSVMVVAEGIQCLFMVSMRRIGESLQLLSIAAGTTRVLGS
jgi:hypothetical protein